MTPADIFACVYILVFIIGVIFGWVAQLPRLDRATAEIKKLKDKISHKHQPRRANGRFDGK